MVRGRPVSYTHLAISINYGDHAWGEASDRIRWAVKNSETAAVNYPQGAYYENIEGLPYSSYGPATQFLLSGKNDGKTVVEAIHDLAGSSLSSSVEVTVETLKDKLYLFQFYPAAKGLTMTYTNGAGEEKTAASDDQGRFAIYEASGIASNVYVQGTAGGELYLGTVYQETLVSQEKDAVSLELYPLNSLEPVSYTHLDVYKRQAKKQTERKRQVKNQAVPSDRTPRIKTPSAVQAPRQTERPLKMAKQPAQAIGQAAKDTGRGTKNTLKNARRTVKTAHHTAKTVPRTVKTVIKTADHTASAARKTAQSAARAAKATAHTTAKAAATTAKAAGKGTSTAAKAALASVKALVALSLIHIW